MTMWRIYDELIAAVPEQSMVSDVMVGRNWVAVRSEGIGLAMAQPESGGQRQYTGSPCGMKTRQLAAWIKSWNFTEAAIGLAAINSAVNRPQAVEKRFGLRLENCSGENLFDFIKPRIAGRKVAVIGHFPDLERLAEKSSLCILERRPQEDDYPDTACEYILHEQDAVIMTATTLINKTMPRLLELSRNAKIAICGPSTPLLPVLFAHGAALMGGCVVEDEAGTWKGVQEGLAREFLSENCRMINIQPENAAQEWFHERQPGKNVICRSDLSGVSDL